VKWVGFLRYPSNPFRLGLFWEDYSAIHYTLIIFFTHKKLIISWVILYVFYFKLPINVMLLYKTTVPNSKLIMEVMLLWTCMLGVFSDQIIGLYLKLWITEHVQFERPFSQTGLHMQKLVRGYGSDLCIEQWNKLESIHTYAYISMMWLSCPDILIEC